MTGGVTPPSSPGSSNNNASPNHPGAANSPKKTVPGKAAAKGSAMTAMTSWSPLEQGLMPILLALMTRTLPVVLAESGGLNSKDSRAVRRLIDKADALLLAQVEELAHVNLTTRRRYWRCLLQAMLEDKAITFRRVRKPRGAAGA